MKCPRLLASSQRNCRLRGWMSQSFILEQLLLMESLVRPYSLCLTSYQRNRSLRNSSAGVDRAGACITAGGVHREAARGAEPVQIVLPLAVEDHGGRRTGRDQSQPVACRRVAQGSEIPLFCSHAGGRAASTAEATSLLVLKSQPPILRHARMLLLVGID